VPDTWTDIQAGLVTIREGYGGRFERATTEHELRAVRAALVGKKGELTQLLRGLSQLPEEQRRNIGILANSVKQEVEKSFSARLKELAEAQRQAELAARPYDLTLPARLPVPRGHLHPLTRVQYEILDIFRSLGFQVGWGPQVESEENNFTKLAFPPDHPAMDMQDSFWVTVRDAKPDRRLLLRTHTSNVQVRYMSTHSPPMAVVSGGPVYRRDDDVSHSPMFHQIEGFYVDEKVSFAELKGVLTEFIHRLYSRNRKLRFRPSYFPFVEPGAEVDVDCVLCSPDDGSRAACRLCKGTGWLEILGCGMVHPEVFKRCGIDPERYTGFAFGLGVDRVTLLRYSIPDIRLLFENDPRFLEQF
jgi:phenylalanyl-tRNA synthetase alpha chain